MVLNETLPYLKDPLAEARRYLDSTAPGGLLLISLFSIPRSEAIFRALRRTLAIREAISLSSTRGTWTIALISVGTVGVAGFGQRLLEPEGQGWWDQLAVDWILDI